MTIGRGLMSVKQRVFYTHQELLIASPVVMVGNGHHSSSSAADRPRHRVLGTVVFFLVNTRTRTFTCVSYV